MYVKLTRSKREKGWQVVMVSLSSMRLRKSPQPLVKFFDRPESKGVGIWKSASLALGSTASDFFDSGADVVLVATLSCAGGMNGSTGSGRAWRRRELSTGMAGRGADLGRRSPCGMAAADANRDTNTNNPSNESRLVGRLVDRGVQRRCCFMIFSFCS